MTKFAVIDGGSGAPIEPDWSSIFADDDDLAQAREQWGVVVRELHAAGTVSIANGHMIKRLVEARVQYERSARHVAEHGAILPPKSRKAKVGQWNPHWSVMKQADKAISALEVELGIPPIRRDKAVKVMRGGKAKRASDEFLGSVSK